MALALAGILMGGLQWSLSGGYGASGSTLALPVSVRYQVSQRLPLSFGLGVYGQKVLAEGVGLDFGLLLRARYDITHRFFTQLQISRGLTNHSPDDELSEKMHGFHLGVGLAF